MGRRDAIYIAAVVAVFSVFGALLGNVWLSFI